jgi:lipoyl(octanoyl) transferase
VREYGVALAEMRELRRRRARGEVPDTVLLVEHPAVLTVGVQGADGDVLPPDLPVFPVERGGKSTYHGPGQQVAYFVVDLGARGRDVRRFVGDVEEVAVRACTELGVRAGRSPGRRGVWVDGARKIASVGIAVEEWVTSHGLALNVDPDLGVFRSFRPCGFDGTVMTSLARELGRPVTTAEIRAPIRRAVESIFGNPTVEAAASAPPPFARSPPALVPG